MNPLVSKIRNLSAPTLGIFVALGASNIPARADVVIEWNTAMTDYVQPRSPAPIPPFAEVRVYAIAHIAMLHAIVESSKTHGIKTASPISAAAQAAHDVLVHEFSDGAPAFDALLATELAAIPAGPEKDNGIGIGAEEALEMLAARAKDGAAVSEGPYIPGRNPGDYQFTPPFDGPPFNGYAQGVKWGKVHPFSLRSGDQFRPPAPYKLNDIEYVFDFNEIKALGSHNSVDRTPDQTAVADFWYESPGLGWNRVARVLVGQQSNTLREHARLFALLNEGMTDATIAAFDAKYFYNFWRPITAIRLAGNDGNDLTAADPAWEPLQTTPPVPDYPSNHAAMGGAASSALISFFGDARTFTLTSSSLPGQSRTFHQISDAAQENAISRMLVGIHFRLACTVGYDLGLDVGRWILKHPELKDDK